MRHVDLAQGEPALAPPPVLPLRDHRDVGDLAGRGGVVDVAALEVGDPLLEVEALDEPGLTTVHVDRTLVGGAVGAAAVDRADHPPGVDLDQLHLAQPSGPDVGEVGRAAAVGPVPGVGPAPQQTRLRERAHQVERAGGEVGQLAGPQRQLLGGGAQVRAEHVGVGGVEDRRLHRLAEESLGVVDEVGVERVVAGDQHPQGVLGAAAGTTQLLPQAGAGAGEPGHQHRVETAHVDAELEGVGGGQPQQLAAAQRLLEGAPLLGQVAAAVGGHAPCQRRVDLGEQRGGGEGDVLDPAPGAHEGKGADAVEHQVGQQVGGLGGRRAPGGGTVLAGEAGERRLPERERHLAARGAVVDHGQHLEPREPVGGLLGGGHRGRGEHERGVGAVGGADAPQPSQHVGDVRPEHTAVVVALVDHDVAQRAQERRPAVVAGQHRAVQHVGVGEDVLGVVARPVALLVAAVAVVGGDPDVEPERADGGHLVVGQRLGGREVEDGGAAPLPLAPRGADGGEGRQLVGQGLAGRGAGGEDHVPPGPGRLGRLDLVLPGTLDPGAGEGGDHVVGRPGRPVGVGGRAGRQHLDVRDPLGAPWRGGQPVETVAGPGERGMAGRGHPPDCDGCRRQSSRRLSALPCMLRMGVVSYCRRPGCDPLGRCHPHRACWESSWT